MTLQQTSNLSHPYIDLQVRQIEETLRLDKDAVVQRVRNSMKQAQEMTPISRTADPLPLGAELCLDIQGAIIITEILNKLYVGRENDFDDFSAFINLEKFDALEQGVSRLHAAIQLTKDRELKVIDLGSINGTFINGTAIQPFQEYVVQEGDHIHFGSLIATVRYL